jgi:hypothetical protein
MRRQRTNSTAGAPNGKSGFNELMSSMKRESTIESLNEQTMDELIVHCSLFIVYCSFSSSKFSP